MRHYEVYENEVRSVCGNEWQHLGAVAGSESLVSLRVDGRDEQIAEGVVVVYDQDGRCGGVLMAVEILFASGKRQRRVASESFEMA